MRPVFGIDITENKNNDTIDKRFVTETVSAESAKMLEARCEKVEDAETKSDIPGWLHIIRMLCGIFGMIALGSSVKAGVEKALRNAPLLMISGFVCLGAFLILTVYSKMKKKASYKENNVEQLVEDAQKDINAVYGELGVPEDAEAVDVFSFFYIMKDGVPTPKTKGLQMGTFINLGVRMFKTENELCICDIENRHSFGLSELREIKKVDKRFDMINWNKEESPRDKKFKPYNPSVNQFGTVYMKPYYILELERDGERFGIYFPPYELEIFEKLSGLRVSE